MTRQAGRHCQAPTDMRHGRVATCSSVTPTSNVQLILQYIGLLANCHFLTVSASSVQHIYLTCRRTRKHEDGADIDEISIYYHFVRILPSVLWRCWLGDRKGIKPVKMSGGCWRGSHQLDHMQICTSPQTDNHASTLPLSEKLAWRKSKPGCAVHTEIGAQTAGNSEQRRHMKL